MMRNVNRNVKNGFTLGFTLELHLNHKKQNVPNTLELHLNFAILSPPDINGICS